MKKIFLILSLLILMITFVNADVMIDQELNIIREQVKCVFANSQDIQKCYTDDGKFGCSGIGTCTAGVSGEKGTKQTWKSSCRGYAYTVIDGDNDYAEFKCISSSTPLPMEPSPTPIEPPVEPVIIREQVKCIFANSQDIQKCYTDDGKFGCSGIGTCTAEVLGEKGIKQTWKSTCRGYAYTVIDGDNDYAEFKCISSTPLPVEPSPTPLEPPVEPLIIREQVKCIFANSKDLQKCYTDDGKFGCSGIGTCTAEVSGEKGIKQTWKSSCGGYAYTVIDGNNDYAEFKCIAEIRVDRRIISGKGFRYASWECYDNEKQKQGSITSCKSSETWQKYAEKFCQNRCEKRSIDLTIKTGVSKCGVNSFSVVEECYFDFENGDVIFALPDEEEEEDSDSEVYVRCEEKVKGVGLCEGMYQGYQYNPETQKCEIKWVSGCSAVSPFDSLEGCKRVCEKEDSIAGCPVNCICDNQGNIIQCEVQGEPAEEEEIIIQESQDEFLICKDSCPLDGKCYPFGYRKSKMFCSDEGYFVNQLQGNVVCDNNFECSSNVCVDEKCISAGLLEKIMVWFRNIFG